MAQENNENGYDKFNLSTYDMAIIAYLEGILTAVIIYEFIL